MWADNCLPAASSLLWRSPQTVKRFEKRFQTPTNSSRDLMCPSVTPSAGQEKEWSRNSVALIREYFHPRLHKCHQQ